MGRFRTPVTAVGALASVIAIAALAGCVQAPSTGQPSSAATRAASATASATPTPAPTFVPEGTAEQNKPLFDAVSRALVASNGSVDGKTIITALASAGFDKAAMQVTPDSTSIGSPVDSVLFSVRIGESCLIGQRSGAGYSSTLGPALQGGTCLVGRTRPINW